MTHLRSLRTIRRSPAALVILIASAGALLFTGCDKLMPHNPIKWTPPPLPPEEQYNDARLKISNGKPAEAAAALQKLDARGNLRPPLNLWVPLYGGIANLLAGNEPASRPFFTKVAAVAKLPDTINDPKVAKFLADIGEKMAGDKPLPSAISRNYNRLNYEALALYLFAIKDEALDEFDEATSLYRQFTTTAAKDPEPWPGLNSQLDSFRQSASSVLEYVNEVELAGRTFQPGKSTGSHEDREKALADAKAARNRVKSPGKLIASLDKKLSQLKGEFGEQSRMRAEDEDADEKVFPEAKQKWAELLAQFQFSDAKAAIANAPIRSDKIKKEQTILANKADYLDKFKFYLMQELAYANYPKPVKLKNGSTVEGGIARLDDKNLYFKGAPAPVPWTDLAPESIYEIASSLVSPTEEAEAQAMRKWHLGNYAAYIGKTAEARTLMNEAAKQVPDYAQEIPGILNTK